MKKHFQSHLQTFLRLFNKEGTKSAHSLINEGKTKFLLSTLNNIEKKAFAKDFLCFYGNYSRENKISDSSGLKNVGRSHEQ